MTLVSVDTDVPDEPDDPYDPSDPDEPGYHDDHHDHDERYLVMKLICWKEHLLSHKLFSDKSHRIFN